MNQKQKDETLEVFVEAFHEVIVPVLEGLATKEGLSGVKADLDAVKGQLDSLDDKVGMINRRLITVTDHQADKLDDHEKRKVRLREQLITDIDIFSHV